MTFRLILLLSISFIFSCKTVQEVGLEPKLEVFTVTEVVDGDTFYGKDLDGDEHKFRLIGVDCPESRHPRKPKQPFSKEATAFAKAKLEGATVSLEFDIEKYGPYGRELVYVFLEDGSHLNADLVEKGLARVVTYPPNVKYADHFHDLQITARKASLGMWSLEYDYSAFKAQD